MRTKQFLSVHIGCSAFLLLGALVSSGCTSESKEEQPPSPVAGKSAGKFAADGGVERNETERTDKSAQGSDGCDALKLDPPADGEGIQLSIELALEPGQERQVCKLAKLDKSININWSEGRYSKGSHHGFVSQTTYHGEFPDKNLLGASVEDATAVLDCESSQSSWDVRGVLAYGKPVGSTNPMGKGLFPKDVAMKLAAGDIVQVNFHMINVTDKPLKACYKQNFFSIPDDQVRVEAGTMFWFNSFVTVPANGKASATMACPIPEDVSVADQVSHMHKCGVGYKATLLDGDPTKGGKEMEVVYEGTTWDDPPERVNTPAMQLKKGQWISFTCDYENSENRDIAQGQWTSDEMCMFIGTYWPRSEEMDYCSSNGNSIGRIFGTGKKSANELLKCWKDSPQLVFGSGGPDSFEERWQTQKCLTDSCPNASAHFGELLSGMVDPSAINCD